MRNAPHLLKQRLVEGPPVRVPGGVTPQDPLEGAPIPQPPREGDPVEGDPDYTIPGGTRPGEPREGIPDIQRRTGSDPLPHGAFTYGPWRPFGEGTVAPPPMLTPNPQGTRFNTQYRLVEGPDVPGTPVQNPPRFVEEPAEEGPDIPVPAREGAPIPRNPIVQPPYDVEGADVPG